MNNNNNNNNNTIFPGELPGEIIQRILGFLPDGDLLQLSETSQAFRQYALKQFHINSVINLQGREALLNFADIYPQIPAELTRHIIVGIVRRAIQEARDAVDVVFFLRSIETLHFQFVDLLQLVPLPEDAPGLTINQSL